MASAQLLDIIERYYDGVPRAQSREEMIGPFSLFVKQGGGWPYYARPTLGAGVFGQRDVEQVRERQRALGVPEAFEWVADTTPALRAAAIASGLAVHDHPLLVLDSSAVRPAPDAEGVSVRLVSPEDDLVRIGAVGRLAFAALGTAVGEVGVAELADVPGRSVENERERLRKGLTVTAAAFTLEGDPIARGSHQPLHRVSEIVGVGTLPAFRRRGIAAALTTLLIADALQRVQTVFLSANDDAVARIYHRLGFHNLATACIAEPA
ncbi:MAG TPA: GNAT family N-acetyltransferase [Chloroflexota bacterium]